MEKGERDENSLSVPYLSGSLSSRRRKRRRKRGKEAQTRCRVFGRCCGEKKKSETHYVFQKEIAFGWMMR